MAVNTENFNFDPDQLREKYRQERDKRLRADGNDQYKEVEETLNILLKIRIQKN